MAIAKFIQGLAGSGATKLLSEVANNVDNFVETKDEKREAFMELARAQITLNELEAKSRSVWVAGWRPAIGWVCAAGLLFYYPIRYAVVITFWVIEAVQNGYELAAFPLDGKDLIELVLAMLGFGLYRTIEKRMGVTK